MMKRNLLTLLAMAICLSALAWASAQSDNRPAGPAKAHLGKVRHAVFFKFKDDADPQQVRRVVDAFRALPEKIDQIRDFEWGTNHSPEGLNEGLTHAFLVTFDNEADRDAYLPHPAHQEFVKVLRPVLDKVLVVDYTAQD